MNKKVRIIYYTKTLYNQRRVIRPSPTTRKTWLLGRIKKSFTTTAILRINNLNIDIQEKLRLKEELKSVYSDLEKKLNKTQDYIDYLISTEQYLITDMNNKMAEFTSRVHQGPLQRDMGDQINASYHNYIIANQDLNTRMDAIDTSDITTQFETLDLQDKKVSNLSHLIANIYTITHGSTAFTWSTHYGYDSNVLIHGIITLSQTYNSVSKQHEDSLNQYMNIDEEMFEKEAELKKVEEEIEILEYKENIEQEKSENKDTNDSDSSEDNVEEEKSDSKKRKRDTDNSDYSENNKKIKLDTDNSKSSEDNVEEEKSENKETDWSVHLLDGGIAVLKALFGDDSDD